MDRSKIPVDLILANLATDAEEAKRRLKKARDILLGPLDTDIGATPGEVVKRRWGMFNKRRKSSS